MSIIVYYWKKEDFSKASPIIYLVELELHLLGPIICGVRAVYFGGTTRIASQPNIVTESPKSFIRYTPRSSAQRKRVV